MSGDPLRDLDCAARIHVLGNTCRTEAVTTNSFLVSADGQTQPLFGTKNNSKDLHNKQNHAARRTPSK